MKTKILLHFFLLLTSICYSQIQVLDHTPPNADNLKQAAIKINANDAYLDTFGVQRLDSLVGQIGENQTGVIVSDQFASNLNSLRSKIDVVGPGTITLTNGSTAVVGNGTEFLDATTGAGMNYWWSFHIVDSNGALWQITLSAINNDSSATISKVYSEDQIINGRVTWSTTFPGATGSYTYKIVTNYAKDVYAFSFGNNSYARDFGTAFGGSVSAVGQTSFATGFQTLASGARSFTQGMWTKASGNNAVAMGENAVASGRNSFAGGWGDFGSFIDKRILASGAGSFNWSNNTSAQTIGHGANGQGSVILGGWDHNIPSTSTGSAIIGGYNIKVPESTNYTVFMPKLRIGLGNSASMVTDNTNNNILVRDATTGEVEIRDASTLGGTVTASNGLTAVGSDVQLGGTLTANTTLTQGIRSLTATGTSSGLGTDYTQLLEIVPVSKRTKISSTSTEGDAAFAQMQVSQFTASMGSTNSTTGAFSDMTTQYNTGGLFRFGNSTGSASLAVNSSGATLTNTFGGGLQEAADYSSGYTNLSLINKGYADGRYLIKNSVNTLSPGSLTQITSSGSNDTQYNISFTNALSETQILNFGAAPYFGTTGTAFEVLSLTNTTGLYFPGISLTGNKLRIGLIESATETPTGAHFYFNSEFGLEYIYAIGLPTTNPCATAGSNAIWNDAGTLKICP